MGFQFGLLECILYVSDQEASTAFYSRLFAREPSLHVPGMTEFLLNPYCKIGLMSIAGIEKIIQNKLSSPRQAVGIPRCELYLYVEEIDHVYHHALDLGIMLISPLQDRDWGDRVCYFSDPEAHVIAFAKKQIRD